MSLNLKLIFRVYSNCVLKLNVSPERKLLLMKTYKLLSVLGLMATIGLVGCGSTTTTSSSSTSQTSSNAKSNTSTTTDITLDEAKKIAVDDAGVNESDVTYTTLKQETEDGQLVYTIEFYDVTTEYEYEVLVSSGKIVSSETEKNEYIDDASVTATVSKEEATSIALTKVTGASEDNLRIHLTIEDGQPVYEGEIVYDDIKYDFEISGGDGSIIDWDTESVTR